MISTYNILSQKTRKNQQKQGPSDESNARQSEKQFKCKNSLPLGTMKTWR